MGLTSSLFAGLSGMKTNEFRMDVIGNNIANVNTVAYKTDRVTFQSQFSQTFSFGTAPSGTIGGTNPLQVGTGSSVGTMSRDFGMGAPELTGLKTDMAIQGQGLFILKGANGGQFYTRDGSMHFNAENFLVSSQGLFLQGYNADENFNLNVGPLNRIKIPVGEITTATLTTASQFSGNLDNNASVPPTDTLSLTAATRPVLTSTAGGRFYTDAGITAATGATALTALRDVAGNQLFYDDNLITLSSAQKGGETLVPTAFTVGTTGATLDDLNQWLTEVLGIQTNGVPDYTANGVANPGITVTANGEIQVVGNIGHKNQIVLGSNALTVTTGAGLTAPFSSTPFQFDSNIPGTASLDAQKAALGDSVRTAYTAYDSVGNPINIQIVLVKQTVDATGGTVWRFFAESPDSIPNGNADRTLGTGTISFDASGNYLNGTNQTISVFRDGTGALTPQTVELDFSGMDSFNLSSTITLLSQDGFPAGTLADFSIGEDGIITGTFSNGLTRTLGQVVMATFRNYEGLVSTSENLFTGGPNSGEAIVKAPLELGAGSISSATLELSNVDLSREFINLIISSTGFSASSRVIQTSDRLLNELIALSR
jgi:flagellar hook protein FlgE